MYVQTHSTLTTRSIDSRSNDDMHAPTHKHTHTKPHTAEVQTLYTQVQGILFTAPTEEWVGMERWMEFADVHHCTLLTAAWGVFFHRLRWVCFHA